VETYETAAPWAMIPALDEAVRRAVAALELGPHLLARRVTHAYRDGCAPYYTVIARAREGAEEAMWRDVKAAITDAIVAAGGTSTHHHAIGRDVVPWHEKETAPLFREGLRAVKATLDPAGVMNPGALLRER
jgi:alkyldihydroxyacetonephosphate synthase